MPPQVTLQIQNVPPSQKIGYARKGQKIHLRVLTAAVTVRLGQAREFLDLSSPFLEDNGYSFTSTDGLIEMQWEGDVYAAGSSANGGTIPHILFGVD